MEKWGGMRKKVGEGGEGREDCGVNGSKSGDEGGGGVKKGKSRIGKNFTQCKKGSAEGKVGKISRKIVGSRTQSEERREKMGFTGQKTSAISRKIARNWVRNGEK